MHNIWLVSLDPWKHWHGGQLCTNNNYRYCGLHKDDDVMTLPKGLSRYWSGANHLEFELISVYTPVEDTTEWARYRDILNDRTFQCRLEAFVARFRPQPD